VVTSNSNIHINDQIRTPSLKTQLGSSNVSIVFPSLYNSSKKILDAGNYGKWTEKCGKIFLFSHNYPEHQVRKTITF